MSYSSKNVDNPLMITESIELRKDGLATTNEGVADDYLSLGYEPGVGSIYRNTIGSLFYHFKSGIDANDWTTLVEGTPGPDQETYSASMSLGASMKALVNPIMQAGLTLSAYEMETQSGSGDVTPSGDLLISVTPSSKNVEAEISASMTSSLNGA